MSNGFSEKFHDPLLFEKYLPGQYRYEGSAEEGKSATGTLYLPQEVVRDNSAQMAAGGDARLASDHLWGGDVGGPLIGARFGGAAGEENLTAQSQNLNRGAYKRMENRWAEHLRNGDKVFVHIETSEGARPVAYMGYAIYESADGKRSWEDIYFENESAAQKLQWTLEAEEFEWEASVSDQAKDAWSYTGSISPTGGETAGVETGYLGGAAGEIAYDAKENQSVHERAGDRCQTGGIS